MILLANEINGTGRIETMFVSGRLVLAPNTSVVITPPAGQFVTLTLLVGNSEVFPTTCTITKTINGTPIVTSFTGNLDAPFVGAYQGNKVAVVPNTSYTSTVPVTIAVANNANDAGVWYSYTFSKVV